MDGRLSPLRSPLCDSHKLLINFRLRNYFRTIYRKIILAPLLLLTNYFGHIAYSTHQQGTNERPYVPGNVIALGLGACTPHFYFSAEHFNHDTWDKHPLNAFRKSLVWVFKYSNLHPSDGNPKVIHPPSNVLTGPTWEHDVLVYLGSWRVCAFSVHFNNPPFLWLMHQLLGWLVLYWNCTELLYTCAWTASRVQTSL